jgi:MoaA/NifB/PqqE/SkfB family radical SAM enzyme
MRSERVFTNLTCNQACVFCESRRPADERSFVATAAVEARIDAAIGRGASELVLTGGEPALRRDLPRLVARAKASGARSVVLETNAATLDPTRARELAHAGLDVARIHLSGWGEALDAVTRDPGGFAASRAGLLALSGAGIAIEIAVAIVRSTLPLLPAIVPGVAALFEGRTPPRVVWLAVPTRSPDERELLSYEEAGAAIVAFERAARGAALPVKLTPGSGPPPCLLPSGIRPLHIYSLSRGASGGAGRPGHSHLPACGACRVRDRCAGVADDYLARAPLGAIEPIRDDRARRRLSLISTVEEQIARELVTPNLYSDGDGARLPEEIIRVNFHCNQACRFCFVSTHLPPAGDEAVRAAIRSAAERGVKITLSGGEPTLHPRLVEFVRFARELGGRPVQLQTNAVRLDDAALARALHEAGVGEAFVSLHGSTAELSDAVTSAPGTFARTVIGLDHLHAIEGLSLIVNFVICGSNLRDLPAFVRLVGTRWPRAYVNVSFVAPSTDVVPRERALVPRYSEALPLLTEALLEAERIGLAVGGFESMCGIPLCLVPSGFARFFRAEALPAGFDGGEFLKASACARCALSERCFGVRRGYAELHGTDELRPVAPA